MTAVRRVTAMLALAVAALLIAKAAKADEAVLLITTDGGGADRFAALISDPAFRDFDVIPLVVPASDQAQVVAAQVNAARDALRTRGVQRAHVIAADQGAAVALQLALDAPHGVGALVIVGPCVALLASEQPRWRLTERDAARIEPPALVILDPTRLNAQHPLWRRLRIANSLTSMNELDEGERAPSAASIAAFLERHPI